MAELRLLGDRVMVKLEEPMVKRDLGGGIVLHYPFGSHGAQGEINVWGMVEQTGPGKWAKNKEGTELGKRLPMEVKAGDRVMVVWYLTKVETQQSVQALLGERTIIIKPEDVLCVDPC